MLTGAKRIQKKARMYAPVDEGNLEESIKIERRQGAKGRVAIEVGVDESHPVPQRLDGATVGQYAARMHEGFYDLGMRSQAKENRLGVIVGRKYLARAMKEEKPQIEAEMRAAVKATIERNERRVRGSEP
jgi:hypothetical protein